MTKRCHSRSRMRLSGLKNKSTYEYNALDGGARQKSSCVSGEKQRAGRKIIKVESRQSIIQCNSCGFQQHQPSSGYGQFFLTQHSSLAFNTIFCTKSAEHRNVNRFLNFQNESFFLMQYHPLPSVLSRKKEIRFYIYIYTLFLKSQMPDS